MNHLADGGIVITGAAGFVGSALAARLARYPLSPSQRLLLIDRQAFAAPTNTRSLIGDLGSAAVLAAITDFRPGLVVHLAAMPGGASEADPAGSRRANLDASLALIEMLAALPLPVRLLYASSIGVFGVPLPDFVDDDTPARPSLTYGAHKMMVETAIADIVRRGDLDALAVRLPGVVARPAGPSGLKSAFISDLFHLLRAGEPITLPVGPDGMVWIASLERCIDNLVIAAQADLARLIARTTITMPALHVRIDDLVAHVARQVGAAATLVAYRPEPELAVQFAAYPPLLTPAAEAIGLCHDGDLGALVARTLAAIGNASGR